MSSKTSFLLSLRFIIIFSCCKGKDSPPSEISPATRNTRIEKRQKSDQISPLSLAHNAGAKSPVPKKEPLKVPNIGNGGRADIDNTNAWAEFEGRQKGVTDGGPNMKNVPPLETRNRQQTRQQSDVDSQNESNIKEIMVQSRHSGPAPIHNAPMPQQFPFTAPGQPRPQMNPTQFYGNYPQPNPGSIGSQPNVAEVNTADSYRANPQLPSAMDWPPIPPFPGVPDYHRMHG